MCTCSASRPRTPTGWSSPSASVRLVCYCSAYIPPVLPCRSRAPLSLLGPRLTSPCSPKAQYSNSRYRRRGLYRFNIGADAPSSWPRGDRPRQLTYGDASLLAYCSNPRFHVVRGDCWDEALLRKPWLRRISSFPDCRGRRPSVRRRSHLRADRRTSTPPGFCWASGLPSSACSFLCTNSGYGVGELRVPEGAHR